LYLSCREFFLVILRQKILAPQDGKLLKNQEIQITRLIEKCYTKYLNKVVIILLFYLEIDPDFEIFFSLHLWGWSSLTIGFFTKTSKIAFLTMYQNKTSIKYLLLSIFS
jgi:hypothetical protein